MDFVDDRLVVPNVELVEVYRPVHGWHNELFPKHAEERADAEVDEALDLSEEVVLSTLTKDVYEIPIEDGHYGKCLRSKKFGNKPTRVHAQVDVDDSGISHTFICLMEGACVGVDFWIGKG